MLLIYSCNLCILACLILRCTAAEDTKSSEEIPNQITTISEGSDCRCRCILKTEEGEPCGNDPNRKKNVFLVDTISAGEDCRCTCLASVPPDNCKVPAPENPQPPAETKEKKTPAQNHATTIPLHVNAMDDKLFMTISGSAGQIEILNGLANNTDIPERDLASFGIVKMQLKLLKLALALEELDNELNSSSICNSNISSRNILEVAKMLVENNGTMKDRTGGDSLDNGPESTEEQRTETQEDNIDKVSTDQQHEDEGESATSTNYTTVGITHPVSNKDPASSKTIGNLKVKSFSMVQKMTTTVPGVDSLAATSSIANANSTSGNVEKITTFSNNKTASQGSAVDKAREYLHTRTKQPVFVESSVNGNIDNANEILSARARNNQTMEKSEALTTSATTLKVIKYPNGQVAVPRITNLTANEPQKAHPSASRHIHEDIQSNATVRNIPSQTVSSKIRKTEASPEANTSSESAVTDQREHVAPTKTLDSSLTTKTTSKTVTPVIQDRTPPKGSRGKVELYRNSKPKQVEVKKSKSSIATAYYEDYYDYSNTDDQFVVHPPIISSKVEPSGDAVDVAVTTTASIDTTEAEENYIESEILQTTQYSSSDTPAEDNYNFATYDTTDYYDSYDYNHKISADTTAASHSATTTEESALPIENTTSKSQDRVSTATDHTQDACGTLLNLSQPRDVHDFGRKEGAWMKDSAASPKNQHKIFVTNFYYGNNLIEFESISNFKNFRWSNSYMLPYNWIGTGHIVYNGSFYYNRAFSRNLIKFDLKYRFVSAWGHLRNAVYDSSTPFTWRGHTMVHMAADNTGLWVIYPAYSDFHIYQNSDSYVINKINPHDLSTITSWRTSLRRNSVSHFFVVCGVIYTTDRYNEPKARITYAYDTHTRERRALYLPFSNKYSHNVQLLYDFNERKLLSWDNGHQVMYDINLTY